MTTKYPLPPKPHPLGETGRLGVLVYGSIHFECGTRFASRAIHLGEQENVLEVRGASSCQKIT